MGTLRILSLDKEGAQVVAGRREVAGVRHPRGYATTT